MLINLHQVRSQMATMRACSHETNKFRHFQVASLSPDCGGQKNTPSRSHTKRIAGKYLSCKVHTHGNYGFLGMDGVTFKSLMN